VLANDVLVSIGAIPVLSTDFAAQFRARFASPGAAPASVVPVTVRRGSQTLTLQVPLRFAVRTDHAIKADPNASPKAARIRSGILNGTG
jgi:hypothetical protein